MPPRLGRRGAGLGSGSAGRRDPCSRDDLGRAAALGSPAARGAQRCPESAGRQRRSLQPNRALSAWRPPLPAARAPPPRARPPPLPLSSSPRPPPSCPPLAALSAVLYRLLFNPFWAVRLSATKPIYCRDKASSPSPAPLASSRSPTPSPQAPLLTLRARSPGRSVTLAELTECPALQTKLRPILLHRVPSRDTLPALVPRLESEAACPLRERPSVRGVEQAGCGPEYWSRRHLLTKGEGHRVFGNFPNDGCPPPRHSWIGVRFVLSFEKSHFLGSSQKWVRKVFPPGRDQFHLFGRPHFFSPWA